jgi:hypothetical protein
MAYMAMIFVSEPETWGVFEAYTRQQTGFMPRNLTREAVRDLALHVQATAMLKAVERIQGLG